MISHHQRLHHHIYMYINRIYINIYLHKYALYIYIYLERCSLMVNSSCNSIYIYEKKKVPRERRLSISLAPPSHTPPTHTLFLRHSYNYHTMSSILTDPPAKRSNITSESSSPSPAAKQGKVVGDRLLLCVADFDCPDLTCTGVFFIYSNSAKQTTFFFLCYRVVALRSTTVSAFVLITSTSYKPFSSLIILNYVWSCQSFIISLPIAFFSSFFSRQPCTLCVGFSSKTVPVSTQ